jgi:hypothetical protein
MDEESKKLLREIHDLQLKQMELLRNVGPGLPPWLMGRFGLRFVLIATAVIAVVLGLLTMSQ